MMRVLEEIMAGTGVGVAEIMVMEIEVRKENATESVIVVTEETIDQVHQERKDRQTLS